MVKINEPSSSTPAKMRLLERNSQKPLTGYIEVAVRGYSKRGLILELANPYVEGLHIMMNNEGGDSPLLEIVLPEDDAECKLAEAVCFDRESTAGKACFVVELAYLSPPTQPGRSLVWEPFRRKSKITIRSGRDL
jgi:hypothetical protein